MSNLTYVDKSTPIFFLGSNSLEERLDPYYYNSALKDFTESIHFEVLKIKQVVKSFQSGFGVGRQDQANDESDSIIQIRPTNLDNFGKLKFDKNVFIPKELITSEKHLLQKGDVVFNNTNSQEWVGKTAFYDLDERLAFSNHITVLKVDKDKIEPEYLWIILNLYQQKKIFFSICTNWNNQSGVGLELLKNLKIPLPRKDKQREIVECLKLGYAQKHQKEAEAQKLLDSIDDYLLGELGVTLPQKNNSLTSRMFTTSIKKVSGNRFDPFYNETYYTDVDKIIRSSKYSTSKLRRLVNSISGVVYSRDDQINTTNGKVILRANNIDLISNQLVFDDLRFINPDLEISESLKLYEGDILMSSASGSKEHVGKVAYIDNDLDFYFGGFMSVLRRRSNDILPKYLFLLLRSRLYRTMLMRILGGTNINNLGFKMIAGLEIPVPAKPIQEKLSYTGFNKIEEYKKLMMDANSGLLNAHKQIEQMILKN